MILVYAVIALIVLVVLLRRDLLAIGRVQFRGGWKVPVLVVGLFVLQWGSVIFSEQRTVLHMLLLILSHTALIFLVWLNRQVPGAKIFALGIFLNTLVMVLNGGWMPITPETYLYLHPTHTGDLPVLPLMSKNIILPRADTYLWFLSDMIPVALPWRRWAMSVGDLLLIAGIAQFLFQTTSKKASNPAAQPTAQVST